MGVLDRFEKGVEKAVNGVFAKAFRSEVQPVEIASALRRECDDHAAIVGRDRTIAPNVYIVDLGPSDHERLAQWSDALRHELGSVLREHAAQQNYILPGPVSVRFEESDDLDTGIFRVRSSSTSGGSSSGAGVPAASQPVAYPTPSTPSLIISGQTHTLKPTTVLGRSDCDIIIDDPGASRRHAEVRLNATGGTITDLGSTNGTFVDGQKTPSAQLRDGSVITIGRTHLTFRTGSAG